MVIKMKQNYAWYGAINSQKLNKYNNFYYMSKMSIGLVSDWNYYYNNSYDTEQAGWWNIFTKDLFIKFNSCSYEDYCKITQSKEFEEMPVYPNNGSIKIINDIVVVKMTTDPYYI